MGIEMYSNGKKVRATILELIENKFNVRDLDQEKK